MNEITPAALDFETKLKSVVRVVAGNFLEMFDFFLFGFYAPQISATFFPSENHFLSLMKTLMVFGAGFLMRPLGALILGAYIDRIGRKKGLVLTLGLMAMGTLLIAAVPGFNQIGLLAPILVVTGRLLQGFSAGVELGGVSVYLAEMATPGRKGLYVSWQSGSQQVAVIAGAALGYALNRYLAADLIAAWGWRIPFFIACLIIPYLFHLRRALTETQAFLDKKRPSTREIIGSIRQNARLVLTGTLLVVMTTVSFYFITVYTPIFGSEVLHLDDSSNLIVTALVGISNFIWLPIMGSASDRWGRKPLLIIFSALTLVTAYPALHWLASAPSFQRMLLVELWLSFLYASYNGAMVVTLIEVMPESVRTTGFSLAYSLATAIFGGYTPAVSTYLVQVTGNRAGAGIWLSIAAACGLIAVFIGLKSHRLRGETL